MRAILLAAGVGDRLRPFTDNHPKCMVEIAGRTILWRHLDVLSATEGIDKVAIVVGYLSDQIRAGVAAWQAQHDGDFIVEFADNPAYRKGSILSLFAARDWLRDDDAIVMDADVLYHSDVMRRLVDSEHANCFLVDTTAERTGEEMMVCIREGRALHIDRSHKPSTQTGWDLTGEGVGFFKLATAQSKELIEIMETVIGEGLDTSEYEVALDRFMDDHFCGYETIGDLPWTEIDFPEDVDKAATEVLPLIEARG